MSNYHHISKVFGNVGDISRCLFYFYLQYTLRSHNIWFDSFQKTFIEVDIQARCEIGVLTVCLNQMEPSSIFLRVVFEWFNLETFWILLDSELLSNFQTDVYFATLRRTDPYVLNLKPLLNCRTWYSATGCSDWYMILKSPWQ